MKKVTFKYFQDGKEITKTQAQSMFDNVNFTIKDGEVLFTTTATPVSKFFCSQNEEVTLDFKKAQLLCLKEVSKLLSEEGFPCVIDKEIEDLENEIKLAEKEIRTETFNSTRHKYNPNAYSPSKDILDEACTNFKFSTNVHDALQRAEEHQAKNAREENKEAERFGDIYWGLRPITEKEERVLNDWERKTFDGKTYKIPPTVQKFPFIIENTVLNGWKNEADQKSQAELLIRISDEFGKQMNLNGPISQYDTVKTVKEKRGVKEISGKLPIDRMITVQFPNAIEAIAKATLFGHNKYKETDADFLNYQRVEGGSQTYADAGARHGLNKNELDKESGLPHIYHKVWNAMAELELWIKEKQK